MTEEEKKAQAEAEAAKAKAEAETDYKAIAEAEKERREAAERLLAEDRYKASEAKRKEKKEDDEDDEDKPVTEKSLQALLARDRQASLKDSQEAQALTIARANTASEEEAQAAVLFYKNRVNPTGNLEDDIKFAIGGLNNKKILAQNEELKRALKSKESASNDSSSGHQDGMPKVEPKLPANSPLKEYKYMGNGVYSKKLSSGKTLFRNSKPMPGQPHSWVE